MSCDDFLPASNKGFQLLLKMGWSTGTGGQTCVATGSCGICTNTGVRVNSNTVCCAGLGRTRSGRVEPIPVTPQGLTLGVGKLEQVELATCGVWRVTCDV